ncbi:MAG TPA: DmsE family decaheme c-type cytochrome, partial [Candidatus Dormibacteraeota bacterium]|nr:DmsE family decaheme c-type cytochrome [Candidatus Dormibacteraeota bacterium]
IGERQMKRLSGSLVIACAALILYALPVAAARPGPGNQAQTATRASYASNQDNTAPAAADTTGYVGSETCKTCHEDIYNSWEKSPHWKTTLNTKAGPSRQGCEGCHGPGAAHVAGGGDITKIYIFTNHTAKEIAARCETCHASGPQHMNALNSVHTKNGISCISCHSPHHAQTSQFLLVKAQPELCYTCHQDKRAQFEMPFHHRVNEGLVKCTDCHNPHGTVAPNQLRTSAAQDAVCFTCHADKRGPFVFEHEPVKVEGCETCHTPHGSPNAHLLKVSNVNILCLSCHTTSFANAPGAPSFHNQAAQYQACTLCHTQIHGSNIDHTFFK